MKDEEIKRIVEMAQDDRNPEKQQQAIEFIKKVAERAKQEKGEGEYTTLAMKFQKEIQKASNHSQNGQTVSAKYGARLNYLRSLKGKCPEGEKLVYFQKGGKACKACEQAEKVKNGTKIDEISNFKQKQKQKRIEKQSCGSKIKK